MKNIEKYLLIPILVMGMIGSFTACADKNGSSIEKDMDITLSDATTLMVLTVGEYTELMDEIVSHYNECAKNVDFNNAEATRDILIELRDTTVEEMKSLNPPEELKESHEKMASGYERMIDAQLKMAEETDREKRLLAQLDYLDAAQDMREGKKMFRKAANPSVSEEEFKTLLTEEEYLTLFQQVIPLLSQELARLDFEDELAAKVRIGNIRSMVLNTLEDIKPPDSFQEGHEILYSGLEFMVDAIWRTVDLPNQTDLTEGPKAAKDYSDSVEQIKEAAEALNKIFADSKAPDAEKGREVLQELAKVIGFALE